MFKQKRYFLWTLNELLEIANVTSVASNTDNSFVDAFGRKLSFRQLYDHVKQHKELVYNKNIPHATCLCEICENAVYFLKAVNQCLPKESSLPSNPHDIVERFSCDSANPTCMTSGCSDCSQQDELEEMEKWAKETFRQTLSFSPSGRRLTKRSKRLHHQWKLKK